jgi:hypothetical protein
MPKTNKGLSKICGSRKETADSKVSGLAEAMRNNLWVENFPPASTETIKKTTDLISGFIADIKIDLEEMKEEIKND